MQKPEAEPVAHRRFGVTDFGRRFSGRRFAPVKEFDEAEGLLSGHHPVVPAIDKVGQNENWKQKKKLSLSFLLSVADIINFLWP
jgi:hypothetical protein